MPAGIERRAAGGSRSVLRQPILPPPHRRPDQFAGGKVEYLHQLDVFGLIRIERLRPGVFPCELLAFHLGCGLAPAPQFSEAGLPDIEDRLSDGMRLCGIFLAGAFGEDTAAGRVLVVGEVVPQIARHIKAGVPNAPLLLHVRVACAARHFALPIRMAST